MLTVPADVSRLYEIERPADIVRDLYGQLDGLVPNVSYALDNRSTATSPPSTECSPSMWKAPSTRSRSRPTFSSGRPLSSSCIRLRAGRPNDVWSYDFIHDRSHDGKTPRMLNIIDELTRDALMTRVDRQLNSTDVLDALTDLFILRGPPEFIRSDNGAEFIAQAVRGWIAAVGAGTAFIDPGSPWANGYCESFNTHLRDEPLRGEIFFCLREAQVVIEQWRRHYNHIRPRSSLGGLTTAARRALGRFD